VTALGKLVRTTAFKLSLVYLTVFAIFAACLLGYFAWNTRRLITEQITETVNADVIGLADQYRVAGLRRLVLIVDNRSRRPGSNLYLVTLPSGEALAGNISSLGPGVIDKTGWAETTYRRANDPDATDNNALVHVSQLPGGYRLLVGRDLEERQRLDDSVWTAAQWATALVVVLGLLGGFFITRRVLKRVDAMTASAQGIMTGNLSGRLPTSGSGDELDRLAEHLNAMLERIEALMHGLKEVSDNIAHDLKTPLTRLRNRSEAALRTAKNESDYRAALETTIEESDGLIRTFNALLMIARAEAGQARENLVQFDAAEIARDICELYEPVAEEQGIDLKIETDEPAVVKGNRELVSQALANLVDNAIKYAVPLKSDESERPAAITVAASNGGDSVLLSVQDTGPGIPEADRGRAVERFVRLESSRTQPGSGLGLSLAAAVARLHGGELRLEDNHPGLRAVMALPRAPVAAG
jgi:signal transduction histidine kinase